MHNTPMNNNRPRAPIEDIEDLAPKPPTNELAPKLRNWGLWLLMIFRYGRRAIRVFYTFFISNIPSLG